MLIEFYENDFGHLVISDKVLYRKFCTEKILNTKWSESDYILSDNVADSITSNYNCIAYAAYFASF